MTEHDPFYSIVPTLTDNVKRNTEKISLGQGVPTVEVIIYVSSRPLYLSSIDPLTVQTEVSEDSKVLITNGKLKVVHLEPETVIQENGIEEEGTGKDYPVKRVLLKVTANMKGIWDENLEKIKGEVIKNSRIPEGKDTIILQDGETKDRKVYEREV